jgi:hypothetical protein
MGDTLGPTHHVSVTKLRRHFPIEGATHDEDDAHFRGSWSHAQPVGVFGDQRSVRASHHARHVTGAISWSEDANDGIGG